MTKIALITGASSGIGAQAALLFAQKGYTVYGASRSGRLPALPEDAMGQLFPLAMDVTDASSVGEGVAQVLRTEGCIDVLVHAAGNGISGPLECCTAEDAQRQMDVNFYGAIRMVNAVVPSMREKGSGHVLLVGSVGGVFAVPFQGLYSSSKAALAIYCEGLRMELKPFGVKAALIEPGDVSTGFTDARVPVAGMCEAYETACTRAISRMEKDEQNGMHPRVVANAIFRVAQKKHSRAHTVVGGVYRVFVFLKRLLPYGLVEKLLYAMYLK